MPTWTPAVDLYLHADYAATGIPLLKSVADTDAGAAAALIQGDTPLIRLWILRRSPSVGAAATVLSVASGSEIIVAAKATNNLAATSLLAVQTDWTQVGTDDTLHYEAILDLNTSEIAAAFGNAPSLALTLDAEFQTAGDTRRVTIQFPALLRRQVYSGTETSPTPATPAYPAATSLLVAHTTLAAFRAVPTAASPRPVAALLAAPAHPTYPKIWLLTESDPGPDAPADGKIRANDYNDTTNPRRWASFL